MSQILFEKPFEKHSMQLKNLTLKIEKTPNIYYTQTLVIFNIG
jgi:hypothetical protein